MVVFFLTEDKHEEEVSCLGGMEDSLQSATRPGVAEGGKKNGGRKMQLQPTANLHKCDNPQKLTSGSF